MGIEFTGSGDPLRSLLLLWRKGLRHSRSALNLETIIRAGMDLADEEGLETLSMRRIAERLKAGTMSLYTHIPSKSELIDLMLDAALGELYAEGQPEPFDAGPWKDALRYIAEENRKLFQRHPWILGIGQSRPPFGPNVLRKYELELRPLDGIGLDDLEIDASLTLVLTYTEGTARAGYLSEQMIGTSGMTDVEWWEKTAPILAGMLDFSKYPVASRVGNAAGTAYQAPSDPERIFRFGLERILDGIAMLIEQNGKRSSF